MSHAFRFALAGSRRALPCVLFANKGMVMTFTPEVPVPSKANLPEIAPVVSVIVPSYNTAAFIEETPDWSFRGRSSPHTGDSAVEERRWLKTI